MTEMNIPNSNLEQVLREIERIKSERQSQNQLQEQQKLPPTMNREKCEKFSDYMTNRFLDACNSAEISGRFQNWQNKPDSEKIKLASDIVKVFLNNISRDISRHQVPIYQRDDTEYKGANDEFDKNITDIRAKMPEILVKSMQDAGPDDGMCVSSSREMYINMTHPMYKNSPLQFLMDLRHELTHVIDMFVPSISPLDADVRDKAILNYVGPHENKDLYKNNPLELNANFKRNDYKQRIDAMLTMQETNRNRAMNLNMLGMMARGYGRAA